MSPRNRSGDQLTVAGALNELDRLDLIAVDRLAEDAIAVLPDSDPEVTAAFEAASGNGWAALRSARNRLSALHGWRAGGGGGSFGAPAESGGQGQRSAQPAAPAADPVAALRTRLEAGVRTAAAISRGLAIPSARDRDREAARELIGVAHEGSEAAAALHRAVLILVLWDELNGLAHMRPGVVEARIGDASRVLESAGPHDTRWARAAVLDGLQAIDRFRIRLLDIRGREMTAFEDQVEPMSWEDVIAMLDRSIELVRAVNSKLAACRPKYRHTDRIDEIHRTAEESSAHIAAHLEEALKIARRVS